MSKPNVVVYTSDGCHYCNKLLDHLDAWKVEYIEKNISQNTQYYREMKQQGVYGTPVTFVEDNKVLGFQKNKLEKLLEQDEVSSYKQKRTSKS